MLLSSERPFVGAFAFCIPGATLLRRNGLTQTVLPESVWNMADGILRFPRNLGESYFLLLGNSRLELPGYQLQALAVHSSGRERKQRVQPRYRQAKETKCGEMAVGCRSTRIVLMKPGNWSRWTRWREGKTERGCLMLDPGSGNTSEASNLELRINDTAQDSIPGIQRFAVWRIQCQRNRMP